MYCGGPNYNGGNMRLVWLLMIGPLYVGIVMGVLHPEFWKFITGTTVAACGLLFWLERYVK